MKDKGRVDPKDIEEEINYNVYKTKPDEAMAMRETMKLLKDELIEIIKTYLDPWVK